MTDRHIQVSAFPDGLPVAARSPVWLGASLGYAVERAGRQFTAWGLGGFGAVVGGLVLFSPLIDGGTTQLPVFIIRLVVLVSAVIWLLGRTKEGELFLPQTRLDVCVALFAWWAALSLLWAPYKNASLQWVLSILFYAALFVMVTQGIRSQTKIWTQILVVTGIGVFEGLWGSIQYLWMGEARARGTFFNPNFFSAYESAVVVLSLGVLLFTKRNTLPASFRSWLWAAAAVSLAAVVMAQSRGASAALVGAVTFLGNCSVREEISGGGEPLSSGSAPFPQSTAAQDPPCRGAGPYAYARLDIWRVQSMRLADQPLGIGVGMFKQGSFQERFPIEGDIVRYRKRPESAHNEYLQMGVELGVVGLVLFLCGAGILAAEVRQLLRASADKIDRGLVMGLTGSALVLLLHAAVDSTFHEPALVILLVILGGLVHNLYMQARPDTVMWRRIVFSYHPLRAAYVIAAALVVAVLCAQPTLAWYAHEEGKRHAVQSDLEGALAWYIRAADIDPGTTGYHDSIARTAIQLHRESGASDWLIRAAEEEAIARRLNPVDGRFAFRAGSGLPADGLASAHERTACGVVSESLRRVRRNHPLGSLFSVRLFRTRSAPS